MKIIFLFVVLVASALTARAGETNSLLADEVWVSTFAAVEHFNGTGNEDPDYLDVTFKYNLNETVSTGFNVADYENSRYKRTTVLSAFAEKDLVQNTWACDEAGVGAMLGYQLRKGYDIPVLGNVYGYCQKWRVRGSVAAVPDIGGGVVPHTMAKAEFNVWKTND